MNATEQHDEVSKTTEELCNLFSTTVSSLASDSAALQQIKSLSIAIKNEENDNPNEIKDSLVEVDAVVTELEGKVRMLQEIVAEEKRSLKDMESVKKAAEAQYEILQEMVRACDSAIEQEEHYEQKEEHDVAASATSHTAAVATTTPRKYPISAATTLYDGVLQSGAKRVVSHPRRDSVDPREKRHNSSAPSNIHLERVSEAEWNNISRTVRGRITLAVVNDALRDIERVFQKKYAVLAHKISGQKELQQKLLNSHRELQVEEHGNDPWVSEQDLRQCCAFFRNGESTARAILLIIRTLRRLKQVPAKHSQVTYVCLSFEDY